MSYPLRVASSLSLFAVALAACGGGASEGGAGSTAAAVAPRPGGPVDLLALASSSADVLLHTDLGLVRAQDPVRYARIRDELIRELALTNDPGAMAALLDRADSAVGAFSPGGADQEGVLLFSWSFSEADFQSALGLASARHGSTPAAQVGADGRQIYPMGGATLVRFDQWTWAVAQGASMRAHLTSVPLTGGARPVHDLIEFGPRIGLPAGAAQAWADQGQQVGVDMVGLVFAGENPQMVRNFVATVRRHLGI